MLFMLILLTSCASNVDVNECLPTQTPSGFWSGTWHGLITVPAFIGSLIWDDVAIYAVNNNGGWYDFGFVGGLFFIIKILTLGNDK